MGNENKLFAWFLSKIEKIKSLYLTKSIFDKILPPEIISQSPLEVINYIIRYQNDTEKIEINESKETVNIGETIPNDSTSITSQTETSNIYEKPSSKYFLFTEGYTMEDVSEAAQNYLKSSGYAGECVPLQDSEGVYIGMKVIFY